MFGHRSHLLARPEARALVGASPMAHGRPGPSGGVVMAPGLVYRGLSRRLCGQLLTHLCRQFPALCAQPRASAMSG
jgi:hypothetical protein